MRQITNRSINEILTLHDKEIILCLLDIDNFNFYNLTNSFESGNIILDKITDFISNIPTIESWTRLGSDEFVFSCLGNFEENKKHLFPLLQNIQEDLNITVSIGITTHNENKLTSERIFTKLKYNLLVAKENGKNKIYID